MRQAFVAVAMAVAVWIGVAGGAVAQPQLERRVALVIGNGAYQNVSRLANAPNDADTMARLLTRLGFEVETVKDQSQRDLGLALRRFSRRADGADVALFFYAGHGIQANDVNYLLPVDSSAERPEDLRFDAVDIGSVLSAMQGARARLLFLDACRNNPLADRMAARSRGVSRGLARVETSEVGTLIAFATAPGTTADDGSGANSPFTMALLEHLATPGLEVRAALTRVRNRVMAATGDRQVPWENSSLRTEVYLASVAPEPPPPSAVAALPPPLAPAIDPIELRFWESAERGNTLSDYHTYLRRFPAGNFADFARNRVAALEEGERRRQAAEVERQRLAEAERQRQAAEAERQRQIAEAEHQRQAAEAERLRQAEAERQRQAAESERQRQAAAEAERQRQAEAERQRQVADAERQRQAAVAERQREAAAEAERQRQAAEAERQRGDTAPPLPAAAPAPVSVATAPAARAVSPIDRTLIAVRATAVRGEAAENAARLGQLAADVTAQATGRTQVGAQAWYRVAYQGREGWVAAASVREVDPAEVAAWSRVRESREEAALEDFVRIYPRGYFAERARQRLQGVRSASSPAATVSPSAALPQVAARPPASAVPTGCYRRTLTGGVYVRFCFSGGGHSREESFPTIRTGAWSTAGAYGGAVCSSALSVADGGEQLRLSWGASVCGQSSAAGGTTMCRTSPDGGTLTCGGDAYRRE